MSVSVIIPTYNRGKALLPTLESAARQTYTGLAEIIVIDDASADDTYRWATRLDDARLRVIRHPQNKGVSGAINTGIRTAAGEFIAILEHDDLWLPEKLAQQLPLFQNPAVGLVYCGVAFVDERGQEKSRFIPQKRGHIYRDLLFKSHIPTSSTVVVRRACFDKVGLFDESLQGPQDYDMWIRIAQYYEVDFAPEILVNFAAYEHARLNRPSRLIPMYHQLNAKFEGYHYSSPLLKRRVMAYRHYTLAGMHSFNGQTNVAQQAYLRSLALWPFNAKCWLGLAVNLAGTSAARRFAHTKARLLAWGSQLRARRR